MTEDEKLNAMFDILTQTKWITSERYRNGTVGLINEIDTKNQLDSISFILKNLMFLRSIDILNASEKTKVEILEKWRLDATSTLIVGVAEGDKTCGSLAYIRAIENDLPSEWSKSIKTQFKSAFEKRGNKANLIIVDDFIGTGNKVTKLINSILANPKTKNYKIYFCGLAGMTEGYKKINTLLSGRCFFAHHLSKCITDQAIEPLKSKLLSSMKTLEEKNFRELGEYSLGYKQSEAAFYLEGYNIPNNNFPILWRDKYADGTKRNTIFTRR